MNRIILGVSLGLALGFFTSPLGAKEPEGKTNGAIYAPAFALRAGRPRSCPCRRAPSNRAVGSAIGALPPATGPPAIWTDRPDRQVQEALRPGMDAQDNAAARHADPRLHGLLSAWICRMWKSCPTGSTEWSGWGMSCTTIFCGPKPVRGWTSSRARPAKTACCSCGGSTGTIRNSSSSSDPMQSGCSTSRLTISITPCNTVTRWWAMD